MTGHSAIHINYRRDDTGFAAGKIYDQLVHAFGEQSVSKDIENFPFGLRFSDFVAEDLGVTHILLVLVGPKWLDIRDTTTGRRRLDDPEDYVRIEVETALRSQGVLVLPVLVDDATMPTAADLPESLHPICEIATARIGLGPGFDQDMRHIIGALDRSLYLSGAKQEYATNFHHGVFKSNDTKQDERYADEKKQLSDFKNLENNGRDEVEQQTVADHKQVEQKRFSNLVHTDESQTLRDAVALQLFISHAAKDGGLLALELTEALERNGVRCWLAPRDVKVGLPYAQQIVEAINSCAGLVLLLTPSANESQHVLSEVNLATRAGKMIAPVFIDHTEPSSNLLYYLNARHGVNWTNASRMVDTLLATFQIKAPE